MRWFNSRHDRTHFNFFSNCAEFTRELLNVLFPGAIRRNFIFDLGMTTPKAELRVVWRNSLAESLADAPNEVVPYKLLRPVVDSVKKVIGSRLRLFHGEKLRPATIVGVV
jgi:hypothetical protein